MSEQHLWQRRASRALVDLLEQHKDLPVLSWSVSHVGCRLLGHVTEHDRKTGRAQFEAWRDAFGGTVEEDTFNGRVYLRMAVEPKEGLAARVVVTADFPESDEEAP